MTNLRVRAAVSSLRRSISEASAPAAQALPTVEALVADLRPEEPEGYEAARNAVTGALDDVAAMHDRSHSLQDELTARLAEETNRRLHIVSVVTTVVMPATLVSGFFGMNAGGMPWAGAPLGTLYSFALCVVSMLATLLWLRRKNLLQQRRGGLERIDGRRERRRKCAAIGVHSPILRRQWGPAHVPNRCRLRARCQVFLERCFRYIGGYSARRYFLVPAPGRPPEPGSDAWSRLS
jgi:hypothetical protein